MLILWLLFPAGPPCYTHRKEHRVQPSWALPRQINNVNLRSVGQVIFPALSSPLTVLNIHPDLFLIGVGEPEMASYKSPWILEYPGTWWRRKWTRACHPSRDERKGSGALWPPLGRHLGTNKKEGRSHCYVGRAEAPSLCCFTVRIMHVSAWHLKSACTWWISVVWERKQNNSSWNPDATAEKQGEIRTYHGIQYQLYLKSHQSLCNVTPSPI